MADQPKKREKADDASRFDDVLRRMLSTPPKPHEPAKAKSKSKPTKKQKPTR